MTGKDQPDSVDAPPEPLDLDALVVRWTSARGRGGYGLAMAAVRRHLANGGEVLVRCWEGEQRLARLIAPGVSEGEAHVSPGVEQ